MVQKTIDNDIEKQLKLFSVEQIRPQSSKEKSSFRIISIEEAIDLIEREESDFYDRKALTISGKKLQKIAVAFANTNGGEFVIGISDKEEMDEFNQRKERWYGTSKIEDFNPYLQNLFEIKPIINFKHEYLRCPSKPGLILLVTIPKSTEIHKTTEAIIYKRVGAQSLPIQNEEEILKLLYTKGAKSYEDTLLEHVKPSQVIDATELKGFLKNKNINQNPVEFLRNQDLINPDNLIPKVASILLFADFPCNINPRKCNIKIVRYETRKDDPERDHLKGSYTIEGPLYKQIHQTVSQITKIMSSVKIYTSEGLKKVEYPPEAIWEIVVNAVIHRDYSVADDIHIKIFDNRIEVISPGSLPGFVTVDNILDSRYARNPKIERTLHKYKNPPNKDLGEGLNTAFQKMKDWKLRPPKISEEDNYVKVIIAHTPLAAPSEAILEFLKTHTEITNKEARDITGIKSENQVSKEFGKLAKTNLIEPVPEKKGAASAWRLKTADISPQASP